MQKEIKAPENKQLYTIVFECYADKWSFIDQVWLDPLSFKCIVKLAKKKIIKHCVRAASKNRSFSAEERLWEEKFNRENSSLLPLNGLINSWIVDFSFADVSYTVNIIKSSTIAAFLGCYNQEKKKVAKLLDTVVNKVADLKLDYYCSEYITLKSTSSYNSKLNSQRIQAEKYMHYWNVKIKFLKQLPKQLICGGNTSLFTIIFEYGGGTYISQIKLSEDLFYFLLVVWTKRILIEKSDYNGKKLINKKIDRLLLMEKVVQPIYQLQPLPDFINTWCTYLTLSQGIGHITVIKTDEEPTLQEVEKTDETLSKEERCYWRKS